MDQGIIAATKVLYRRELLDVKLSIMLVASQLRAEAKERKMASGTQGLANGHHPHMSDAADLLKLSWNKVTTQTIARCWVKAETLPKNMEDDLVAKHGKVGRAGSKGPVKDPVKELADTINEVSSRVAEPNDPGSPPDKEIVDLLANLDINPGQAAGEAAIKAVNEWATFEDQEDVVEAFRQDAMDEMTEQLNGTFVEDAGVSDDDEEESEGEGAGGAGMEPPPYSQLSQHFGPLERAAGESDNDEAAFHLQKAKMAMIKAYASKPVRQSDMREFL